MFSRQTPRRFYRGERDKVLYAVYTPRLYRLLPVFLVALALALCSLVGTGQRASAAPVASGGTTVDVTELNSEINASSQRFLTQAITTAEHDGSQALVIQVNTPGGDIDEIGRAHV